MKQNISDLDAPVKEAFQHRSREVVCCASDHHVQKLYDKLLFKQDREVLEVVVRRLVFIPIGVFCDYISAVVITS